MFTNLLKKMRFLKFSFIILCLAAGTFLRAENVQPNVLFIAVDDLNDWVGCLGGNPDTKTPNIDRLAARGMLFTNAQCAAPSCVPSRGALMTGVMPSDSGIYCNRNGHFRRYEELKDQVTLTQYFGRHGYHTMGVGKILHNSSAIDYNEHNPITYWRNPEPEGVDCTKQPRTKEEYLAWWKPVDVNLEEMTDWKMTRWAAEQLKRSYEKPFFLAYNDGTEELYDHDKDPMEWHNLAGKAEHARIQAYLKKFVPKNPVPPRNPKQHQEKSS